MRTNSKKTGESLMEATLELGEVHPLAATALAYVKANIRFIDIEAMTSCALSGNRAAEICLSTWNRLENNEPISDRYIMGLAWLIHGLREE